jgi:hypothetical protein
MGTATKTAKTPPDNVIAEAQAMLAALGGNERLCGDSRVVEGYWVETHTLGCRNAADEPEEQWEESHARIREEYEADGVSTIVYDEDSSNFATITPQAAKTAAVNYDEMFNGVLKILPEAFPLAPEYQADAKSEIKQEIQWAKQHLKKQDRIVWFLRWFRLGLLQRLAQNKPNLVQAWVRPEAERMGKITGKGAEEAMAEARHPASKSNLDHFMGTPAAEIQNTVWDAQTPGELLKHFSDIEKTWKEEARKYLEPMEGDEVAVQFRDGWAWWKLGRGYCSEEAAAMGHCGNVAGKHNLDERILSLRRPVKRGAETRWEPHLTFILDGDGYIGEMKGRGNEKPSERYHSYIAALLEQPWVKGIKGGGYKPSHNFSLDDLELKKYDRLKQVNPNLLPARRRLHDLGGKPDKELIRRIQNGGHVEGYYDEKLNGWVHETWDDPGDYVEDRVHGDARDAYDLFSGKEEPYYHSYESSQVIRRVLNTLPEEDLRLIEGWLRHNGVQISRDRNEPPNPREDVTQTLMQSGDNPKIEIARKKLWDAFNAGITPAYRADVGEQLADALRQSYGERGMHLVFGDDDFWNQKVTEYRPAEQAASLTDGRTAWGEEIDPEWEGEDEDYYGDSEEPQVEYRYHSPYSAAVHDILRRDYSGGRTQPSKYDRAVKKLKPKERRQVQALRKQYDAALSSEKAKRRPFLDWIDQAFPREVGAARAKTWNRDLAHREVKAEFGQWELPFPKGEGMVGEDPEEKQRRLERESWQRGNIGEGLDLSMEQLNPELRRAGSLLLMKGETQRYWKHGIAKESRPCRPRVNLTFRRIDVN